VLSLAHTKCNDDYVKCAYTQKAYNMCKMMSSLGHEVYLYAPYNKPTDAPLPPHDKFIPVVSEKTWDDYLKYYNTNDQFFKFAVDDPVWDELRRTLKIELPKNIDPDTENFVLCWFGHYFDEPTKGLPGNTFVIEAGIGYTGTFCNMRGRVFESNAWCSWVYGRQNIEQGNWYDTVIPNSYDPDDFPYSAEKDDYFLFVGRCIETKGINIAEQVARKLGKKLYIAGQCSSNLKALGVTLDDQVQYIGVLNKEERGEWMKKAQAVFIATYYWPPFEGVHIESMFCGTPVITSPFGVFSETVQNNKVGFRCASFKEMLWAAQHVKNLDSYKIRRYAIDNFSLDRVRWMYQRYFEQFSDLYKAGGWYETEKNPVESLDRHDKYYVI